MRVKNLTYTELQNALLRNASVWNALQKKGWAYAQMIKKKGMATLLGQYWNHPVTREIQGGFEDPSFPNISGTLHGKGNLYSFIGFKKEQGDPTKPLGQLLSKVVIRELPKKGKILRYRISFPTASQLRQVTKLPWERGRSWAEGIEDGISGLGNYLYWDMIASSKTSSGPSRTPAMAARYFRRSRSKGGLQVMNRQFRSYNFSPRPYLQQIFDATLREMNSQRMQ